MYQILFDPDDAVLVMIPLMVSLGKMFIRIGAIFVIST
jgi:hypothetical protein